MNNAEGVGIRKPVGTLYCRWKGSRARAPAPHHVYFRRVYFRGYVRFPDWHNFVDSDSLG